MTDELQYAKLATHIGETLSPLPTLRGAHVSAYAQLYPALLAPFFGSLSGPAAFHAAHLLNALLFASACIPAYLLARELALGPRWSLACAASSIVLPWNVNAAFVMTEAAAYPVFVWAMLAIVRALAVPSPRRDSLAVAAVVLAVLARTQFLVLGVVLVLAALLIEGRHTLARHRVLAGATVAVAVLAGLLGTRLLGSYSVTASKGSILSWKVFEQAGAHLDVVALGLGLLPLLVGGAWIVVNALERSPFAVAALVTIVALTFEATSYDVRFGGGLAGIRGRYLFYIAPLLIVTTVRALQEPRLPPVALAGVTGVVTLTVFAYDFPRVPGLYVDAPVAVLNGLIQDSGGAAFVAVAAIVIALVVGSQRIPRPALAVGSLAFVFACSAGTAAADWSRLLGGHGPSSRPVTGVPGLVLDWADRVLPPGAHSAILPYTLNGDWARAAILWWDVELWNRSVDRAFVVGNTWDYAPFPHTQLIVDATTGVVAGTENAPPYVIASQQDSRLRLAGSRVAPNYGLDVLKVERPYRALWQSFGLDPDGWTRPGRPAWIHVFPQPGVRVNVKVTLEHGAPIEAHVCAAGDVALPTGATGTAPALPLGPGHASTRRTVGVHVVLVELSTRGAC